MRILSTHEKNHFCGSTIRPSLTHKSSSTNLPFRKSRQFTNCVSAASATHPSSSTNDIGIFLLLSVYYRTLVRDKKTEKTQPFVCLKRTRGRVTAPSVEVLPIIDMSSTIVAWRAAVCVGRFLEYRIAIVVAAGLVYLSWISSVAALSCLPLTAYLAFLLYSLTSIHVAL